MGKETPLTKEFFLDYLGSFQAEFGSIRHELGFFHKEFESIRDQFSGMRDQFSGMRDQFKSIDVRFARIEKKLAEHDDLLEMIASEVSGTQNLLNELAPARKDHETRITRLERGFTKLILKS